METFHPNEIELGLDRIKVVANRLGLLDKKPQTKVITVAGTNGKGTFVRTLDALLLKAGYRVGSYTSPHVIRYNERIKINGTESSDALLCSAFEKLDDARGEVSLTYFEFGTLAAFLLFAEAGLDYWILEIGMGGRLDAVNILDPDISVITSISMDHENWLGSTRELIGAEKAGIVRRNGLVICCDEDPPQIIRRKVEELQATAFYIDREFGCETDDGLKLMVSDAAGNRKEFAGLPKPELPLPSVAAAVQAFHLLDLALDDQLLESCLSRLKVAGRFQRVAINNRYEVVLDVAHNPAAMKYLAVNLSRLRREGVEKIEVVVAMMRDKNMAESLDWLVPLVDCWYPVAFAQNPRAAEPELLTDILKKAGVDGGKIQPFSSTVEAMRSRMQANTGEGWSMPKCVTIVTGSFYPVGEASSFLLEWQRQTQMAIANSVQEAERG